MSIRRTVQAVVISALVAAGGLAGGTAALAATQDFLGHAADFGPEAAPQRAQEQANAMASAAGYNPSTQCTPIQSWAREISNNGAWEGWVVVRCAN
ncbi:hypothetical protein [Actinophytocola sp.]|uniref:hypothetical protein n=1 Tax=Actinophytocola sp. TaxID=1872138 RepID=UPI003899ED20